MNNEFKKFKDLFVTKFSIIPPNEVWNRDEIIKYIEICNKIISDMNNLNSLYIQRVLSSATPDLTNAHFAKKYNNNIKDISTFQFPDNNSELLKKKLSDTIDFCFIDIHDKWLESLPALHFRLPEPKKTDFMTDQIDQEIKLKYLDDGLIDAMKTTKLTKGCRIITKDQIPKYLTYGAIVWTFLYNDHPHSWSREIVYDSLSGMFSNIKSTFQPQLDILDELFQLSIGINIIVTRKLIINQIKVLNRIISDMELFNKTLLDIIINDKPSLQEFLRITSLTDKDIIDYKFDGYCVPELKKSLSSLIDKYLPQLHAYWYKLIPPEEILRFNNSAFKNNKHKSPGNVDISSTIAIHVIIDAVLDSYSINVTKDLRASPGYILYTFSPNVPPGSLIVMNPPFLTYLETASDFISRMNFKIVDQNFSLIDLRGEQLQLTLEIRS